MPGRVQELVLPSFRVDAESLRDLAAVVRQGAESALTGTGEQAQLRYEVQRKDHLSYGTSDLEEVLQERNGLDTKLRSVALVVSHPPALSMTLAFKSDEGLRLEAEGADRARVALLASDIRALARERMRGRGSGQKGAAFKYGFPVAVGLVTAVVLIYLASWYSSQAAEDAEREYKRAVETYQGESVNAHGPELAPLDEALREIDRVLVDGTLEQKVDVLVREARRQANEARRIFGEPAFRSDYPEYPEADTWIGKVGPALLLVPPAVGVLTYVLLNSLVLRPERVFLIGAEVERRATLDRRRDRVIWTVGVAFVVGVASGLAVTALS